MWPWLLKARVIDFQIGRQASFQFWCCSEQLVSGKAELSRVGMLGEAISGTECGEGIA